MKYTSKLLDEMIKEGFETNHVDFKLEFDWDHFDEYRKAKIAKHMAAMSNISGGGLLIFGVSDAKEVVGLSEHSLKSFDRTRVDQILELYLDPIPRYNAFDIAYQNKKLLIFEIEEFLTVPIICKMDKKNVLRAGGMYIRHNASSVIIQSAEAMRDLIELAVKKKKHELLDSIENILESKSTDDWKL
jgi:predicted HTH transcriptional regulator